MRHYPQGVWLNIVKLRERFWRGLRSRYVFDRLQTTQTLAQEAVERSLLRYANRFSLIPLNDVLAVLSGGFRSKAGSIRSVN